MKVRQGGFRAVALQVLADAGKPLTAKEIVDSATKRGLLKTTGKTPANTMYSVLVRESASGAEKEFVKAGHGRFDLTEAGRKIAKDIIR